MSRGPQIFRQRDVTKAVKGVVAAGVPVHKVEVDKAGKIVVVVGEPDKNTRTESNSWDNL